VVQERTNVAQHYAPQNISSDQLVISIKEARKILGKDAHNMSDSQVKDLIEILTSMADDFLQNKGSKVY